MKSERVRDRPKKNQISLLSNVLSSSADCGLSVCAKRTKTSVIPLSGENKASLPLSVPPVPDCLQSPLCHDTTQSKSQSRAKESKRMAVSQEIERVVH